MQWRISMQILKTETKDQIARVAQGDDEEKDQGNDAREINDGD
jgi:hypothetical protein